MAKTTLAKQIKRAAKGRPITACVIGAYGWDGYMESDAGLPNQDRGVVLTWEQARPQLEYVMDTSFGAPECNAVYAWTEERVIFVCEYDGATGVVWVPRYPVECAPVMGGHSTK